MSVRRVGYLLVLASALARGGDFQTPAITAQALAGLRGTAGEPLIVDVRSFGEYKAGHVPGAINIPTGELEARSADLRDAAQGVVLYCTRGERTLQAEEILLDHRIVNLLHLEGGLGGWLASGQRLSAGWEP
jgi:rhodanese-related sulfurtransferase